MPTPATEPAIPPHLRGPRTRPNRVSDRYAPAGPAYSARFDPAVDTLVMAYLGVQDRTGGGDAERAARDGIAAALARPDGPDAWDRSRFIDPNGHPTTLFATYWRDPAAERAWWLASGLGGWWDAPGRLGHGVGLFRERFAVPADRFETLFGDTVAQGCAHAGAGMSGAIREHGYWGSARDRLAASQTDDLEPAGAFGLVADGVPVPAATADGASLGRRVQVVPPDNLCVIRFGQDLSRADGAERALYAERIDPPLQAAMAHLTDRGPRLGCLMNRFVHRIDAEGAALAASYSLGVWRSLAHLERWAESHTTHLDIFVAAMKYFRSLRGQHKLSIYHEMAVLPAAGQDLHYVDCAPGTGLLAALA